MRDYSFIEMHGTNNNGKRKQRLNCKEFQTTYGPSLMEKATKNKSKKNGANPC